MKSSWVYEIFLKQFLENSLMPERKKLKYKKMFDFLYFPYLSISHFLFLTFKFLFVDILLFISEGLDKICVREDTEDHTPSSPPT